jgi:tetratricopeptide (TPR) repeat protein
VQALEHAERAVQLAPLSSDTHLQLSAVLMKQDRLGRAITEARRAVELGPENAFAYDVLFTCLRQLQRNGEAIDVARDALAVSPFNAELHYRLGLAAGQDGDFATAANQFVYALLLRPDRSEPAAKLRVTLATAYAEQTRFPDAIVTVKEALSLAKSTGDTNTVALCENLLASFQANRARRDEPNPR